MVFTETEKLLLMGWLEENYGDNSDVWSLFADYIKRQRLEEVKEELDRIEFSERYAGEAFILASARTSLVAY